MQETMQPATQKLKNAEALKAAQRPAEQQHDCYDPEASCISRELQDIFKIRPTGKPVASAPEGSHNVGPLGLLVPSWLIQGVRDAGAHISNVVWHIGH